MRPIILLLTIFGLVFTPGLYAQNFQKHRTIILTDMEADPDDTQSLIRLLLYSNQIDIEGLIATTSCWLQDEVNPDSIEKILHAYKKVRPNLIKHEADYPTSKALLKLIKSGKAAYGMKAVGQGMDSEGSNWIIKTLEQDDDRPLWISVWGGVNTLAQALYKIKHTKSETQAEQLISKLRVYTISDQDDSGLWIRNNFPDLFYIVSPGDHYGSATWTGINTAVDKIDNYSISNDWFAKNIQQDHSPLGAAYPDVSWGVEGDTPAYLSLIPNGLNDAEHPDKGGWGGRYELYKPNFDPSKKGSSVVTIAPETRRIWTNAIDTYVPEVKNEFGRSVKPGKESFTGYKETLWRWREEFQNDFAARMDWTVKGYEDANHPPVPNLKLSELRTAKSGKTIRIDASQSYDPDGDSLGFYWFNYAEAGTLSETIKINQPENSRRVRVTLPKVEKEETAHFILKLSDKGKPALTRYKRIVVTITP